MQFVASENLEKVVITKKNKCKMEKKITKIRQDDNVGRKKALFLEFFLQNDR